jgi:nicotinamide-nucleotide amidase
MSLFAEQELRLARDILAACRKKGITITTAESCTGGLVAACFTEIAGASDVFERGFVTYSNAAKRELLGVKLETLQNHGAVSTQTALEMATGALAASKAGLAVSVTGIAGPGGGSKDKPVGLVYFAVATKTEHESREMKFGDVGRSNIRLKSLGAALHLVKDVLSALL